MHGGVGGVEPQGSPLSRLVVAPSPAATAFASRVACGAALRGGSAALPQHPRVQSPVHQRPRVRLHHVATLGDNARSSMLSPTPTMVLPLPMLVVVSQTARVQSVIQTMVLPLPMLVVVSQTARVQSVIQTMVLPTSDAGGGDVRLPGCSR